MIKIKIPNATRLIMLIAILCFSSSYGQNTQIRVSEIRSGKGQIILNVFKNNEDYQEEKVSKKLVFEKKIENGSMIINCTLEPGTYGITLIDDENKSGELNKNMLGIPKEGFGFSDFFMEKMKKPAFDDFKVNVINQNNKISIRVKYM
ncbi:DUF2141 domain-containing protein [Flavobacterium pectinovorum]|uniref:Uncharacterized conserved protein, DUF2141 family n=1 Tax=Flavobacterium pectinovorum TaxID=29533 RepID=A0AB36NXX4_9FLAO|nr:DUF2141 domain-containing protein [Flavobacterium pectinovorum]OXB02358.1 hypothetical protein B0A72_17050 [Flavobacterium pectinovorum]SHM37604.1 Uncharacterized conserved protein, DUF2141 family [Flavobacterium pectinovorum]